MNDGAQSAEFQVLLDEAACRRVLGRYGPALDWRDADALASIVWPDATVDYGFFKGNGSEYVRTFIEIERAAGRPFHLMVCDRVAVKGSIAEAESVGIALTMETSPDGVVTSRQYWGRYLDELEKRGSEWRISKRTYIVHGSFDVAAPASGSSSFPGLHVATNLTVEHPMYRKL